MADFLDEKRREISERLRELKPLVDEYHRLEAAQAALEGVNPRATARRAPARGRAATGTSRDGGGRRGRPRGSGTRSKEALELVRARPGITIPEHGGGDGHQAELPLSRAPHPGRRRPS